MTRRPFLWGAAISAHQTEGENRESDWWTFEHQVLAQRGIRPSLRAADHWHRYADDIDALANAGLNAFRCSIEWAKIEPEEGRIDEDALAHYEQVFAYANERQIRLCITLWHFSLPQWASDLGGMRSARVRARYLAYVRICGERFDRFADIWQTMNEPLVYAMEGYRWGHWPPSITSRLTMIRLVLTLRSLHRSAYIVLRRVSKKPIGIAKSMIAYLPTPHTSVFTRGLQGIRNFFWNRSFFLGHLKWHDFIGINYYITSMAGPMRDFPPAERDDMGWESRPEGLAYCITSAARMRKPLYVTENGTATEDDEQRIRYLEAHVTCIKQCIQNKLPIFGYFHWSLIDNYEWDKGFTRKFGLIAYHPVTYKRIPKPSLAYYGQLIRSRQPVKMSY
jgi:beta-glucosidase